MTLPGFQLRDVPDLPGAACKGMDGELWFPGRDDDGSKARAVCATCPARLPCLEYALATEQGHPFVLEGIWGGTSHQEREAIPTGGKAIPDRIARCGTESGHRGHRRRGEDPCEPCQGANREANRKREQRRREQRRRERDGSPISDRPADELDAVVVDRLVDGQPAGAQPTRAEVLAAASRLAAAGRTYGDIAQQLGVSRHYVVKTVGYLRVDVEEAG